MGSASAQTSGTIRPLPDIEFAGAGGAPIYSYIQMREEGMRIISDQILTWLAECDRARELAAATNVIEV